jgi:hypothetical protein
MSTVRLRWPALLGENVPYRLKRSVDRAHMNVRLGWTAFRTAHRARPHGR